MTKFTVPQTFYLQYDGVKFRWISGGEQANYDYPFGRLKRSGEENYASPKLSESGVALVRSLPEEEKEEIVHTSIQFYTPRGFNTWVGDIVNYYRDGKYFLLYLSDSHHHGNRFGGGAHTAALLTTEDFIAWTDYGFIFELEEQWQTLGTGTLFYHNGKYYYTHGFHTSRFLPEEKLVVHYESKTGDVFLDAEIGGSRTLASSRVGLKASSLALAAENATVKEIKLFEL